MQPPVCIPPELTLLLLLELAQLSTKNPFAYRLLAIVNHPTEDPEREEQG
jgi:hypothetical protein